MITLPIDGNYKPMQLPPATTALATTYDGTISSATTVTLNTATTYLEVSAVDKGVFMKYAAGVSSSNFDEYISPNETRVYIVPAGVTAISVIEQSATAIIAIIEK